jgi:protein-tyrosine phosphatase
MEVLFVCAANICRSFMAERIMKGKLKEKGVARLSVSSAGIYEMNDHPADPRTVEILEKHGFNGSEHRSRTLTGDMIKGADLILVMEDIHKETILEKYPEAKEKVSLLKSFLEGYEGLSEDIKDPYHLSDYYYRLCFAEITMSIDVLIEQIIKNKTPNFRPAKIP